MAILKIFKWCFLLFKNLTDLILFNKTYFKIIAKKHLRLIAFLI